jgi:hypothetical protein
MKCQPLQGEYRSDHVFSHPLGFRPRLGPDQAVKVETCVPPGKNTLGPFRAEKLPADYKKK